MLQQTRKFPTPPSIIHCKQGTYTTPFGIAKDVVYRLQLVSCRRTRENSRSISLKTAGLHLVSGWCPSVTKGRRRRYASGSTGPDWEISGTGPPLEKALGSFAFTMAQGIACTSPGRCHNVSLALWWHQGDPTRGHSLCARVLARF